MKSPDLTKLINYFKTRGDIVTAYIFGSYASMRIFAESDIDIAVILDENISINKSGVIKRDIIKDIMGLLSFDKVDFVILNFASPLLCHEVIKKGNLIYSGDEHKRTVFTAKATMRYLDTVHLRKVQDTIIHKKIRSGDFGYFKGCHKYSIEKIRQSSPDSSAIQ